MIQTTPVASTTLESMTTVWRESTPASVSSSSTALLRGWRTMNISGAPTTSTCPPPRRSKSDSYLESISRDDAPFQFAIFSNNISTLSRLSTPYYLLLDILLETYLSFPSPADSILHGTGDVSQCPAPCHSTRYQDDPDWTWSIVFNRYKVERMGLVESKDRFGSALVFDKVVEQTLTDWQISPVTLLTRFGGIIGVGKNLLWIMIFLCSSFLAILKSIHRRVFWSGYQWQMPSNIIKNLQLQH